MIIFVRVLFSLSHITLGVCSADSLNMLYILSLVKNMSLINGFGFCGGDLWGRNLYVVENVFKIFEIFVEFRGFYEHRFLLLTELTIKSCECINTCLFIIFWRLDLFIIKVVMITSRGVVNIRVVRVRVILLGFLFKILTLVFLELIATLMFLINLRHNGVVLYHCRVILFL